MPTPVESMRIVARRLQPLGIPFAFVGGAVVPVLVDHPDLTEFRPTKDVDVIVEVVSYAQFSALEERLRASGFQHDTSEGSPICRWLVEGCRVDIMPVDSKPLGSSSTVRKLPDVKFSENAGFLMHVNRPISECSGKF